MNEIKNRATRRAEDRKKKNQSILKISASALILTTMGTTLVAGAANAENRQAPEGYIAGTTLTEQVKAELATKKQGSIKSIGPDASGAAAFAKAGVSINWDQAVVESNELSQVKSDGSWLPVIAIPTPVIDEAKALASTPASSNLIDGVDVPKAVYINSYGTNITTAENIYTPGLKAGEVAEGFSSINETTPFGNAKVGTGLDVGNDPSKVQVPILAHPSSSIREGGVISSDGITADVSHTVLMDQYAAGPQRITDVKADGTQTGHDLNTLVDCTVVDAKCGFWMQVMAQGTADGTTYITTIEGIVTKYPSYEAAKAAGIPKNATIVVDDGIKRVPLTDAIWINVKTDLSLVTPEARTKETAIVAESGDGFWHTSISAAAESGAGTALSPAARWYPSAFDRSEQTASIDFAGAFDGNSFRLDKALSLSAGETGVAHNVRYGVNASGQKIDGLAFGGVSYSNGSEGTSWTIAPTEDGVNQVTSYLATYAITDNRYETIGVSDALKAGKTFTAPDGRKATVKVVSVREANTAVYPYNSAMTVDVLVTFDSMPADAPFTFSTDTQTGLAASVGAELTGIGMAIMPGYKLQYKVADKLGTAPAGTPDAVSSKGETVNVSLIANDKAGEGRVIVPSSYLIKGESGQFKKEVTLAGKGHVKVLDNGTADFTPVKGYTDGFPKLSYAFADAPAGIGMEDVPAEKAESILAQAQAPESLFRFNTWHANGTLEDEVDVDFLADNVNAEATRSSIKAVGKNAFEVTVTGVKGNEVFGSMNDENGQYVPYKAGDKIEVVYNTQSKIPAYEIDASGNLIESRLTATVLSNAGGAMKLRYDYSGGIAGAPAKSLGLSFKESGISRYKAAFSTLSLSATSEPDISIIPEEEEIPEETPDLSIIPEEKPTTDTSTIPEIPVEESTIKEEVPTTDDGITPEVVTDDVAHTGVNAKEAIAAGIAGLGILLTGFVVALRGRKKNGTQGA